MSTVIQPAPLLQPTSIEDLSSLEIHLPTLKVISYSGPGNTGGVPTSLEPIVKRLGTKVHWFSVENENAPAPSNISSSAFAFYSAKVHDKIIQGHKRFCARYLWPLFHGIDSTTEFDPEDWKAYKQVCTRVSSECQSVLSQSFPTLCWLNDYQLSLCAPLIAAERGMIVCLFWHVPWPEAQLIAKQPIAKELVEGLLSNRLLGFHTAEYAQNFLQTVALLVKDARVDYVNMTVTHGNCKTQLTVMPMGIDVLKWQN